MILELLHVYSEESPILFNEICFQERMDCSQSSPLQILQEHSRLYSSVPSARRKMAASRFLQRPPDIVMTPTQGDLTSTLRTTALDGVRLPVLG